MAMTSIVDRNLLSALIFAPVLGALAVALVPRRLDLVQKIVGLATTGVTFLLALRAVALFVPRAGMQLEIQRQWLPSYGISYHLGIDGLSLWLVALTALLTPLALLASWRGIETRVREFQIFVLLSEAGMIGVFCALDLVLFYVFWEAMLVPMYFLIGIWGHGRRVYAAIKFFLFTMAGSVVMLVAFLVLYYASGRATFDLPKLVGAPVPLGLQMWLFAALGLAFAIKVPLVPFHTWLPDAHVEAPTAGSVLLAGVLLKMGAYGFLRLAIPLFPAAAARLAPWIAALAVIGVVYGALVALVQPDMKRLVAYSSVSHLGFVMLGVAALTPTAVVGSVYQMVNHGVSTGALFLLVGMLYERRHTREIAEFGGLKSVMPRFAAVFLLIGLSSMAMPGFNGFVGEFLILMGSWTFGWGFVAVAALGVVLAAGYILWTIQRVFHGELTNPRNAALSDLSLREMAVVGPLVALALLMGMASPWFTAAIEPSASAMVYDAQTQARLVLEGQGR
jgi:NADH-quinone oxidoreductase subunit M